MNKRTAKKAQNKIDALLHEDELKRGEEQPRKKTLKEGHLKQEPDGHGAGGGPNGGGGGRKGAEDRRRPGG